MWTFLCLIQLLSSERVFVFQRSVFYGLGREWKYKVACDLGTWENQPKPARPGPKRFGRLQLCARDTAYSIIRHYQWENGLVVRARGGANNVKRDEEMANCVGEIVERHPEFTLAQINCELRTTLLNKPRICISILRSLLTSTGSWHFKKILKLLHKVAIGKTWRWTDVFLYGARYSTTEIIYIDESRFYLWSARIRGRAERGVRYSCCDQPQRYLLFNHTSIE